MDGHSPIRPSSDPSRTPSKQKAGRPPPCGLITEGVPAIALIHGPHPACPDRDAAPASSSPKEGPGTALRDRRQTVLPPAATDLDAGAGRHPSSVLPAERAPLLRPPARRTSPGRADSGDPRPAPGQRPARPPARRTDAPPCSLQTEGANAQTPIRLRLAASLSVQGRAASSMKTSLSPEARTALSLRTEFRATTSDRRNPTAQFPPA